MASDSRRVSESEVGDSLSTPREPRREWMGSRMVLLGSVHAVALVCVLAGAFMFDGLLSKRLWLVVVAKWILHGLGITLGYHRLFSHRAFEAHPLVAGVLALLGCGTFQGDVIWWSKLHRLHHSRSDSDVDPYGPQHGFWYSHFLWILEKREVVQTALLRVNVSDLEQSAMLRFCKRHYLSVALASTYGTSALGVALLVSPASLGEWVLALLWSTSVATVMVWHSTWFVNSLAHWLGDDETSIGTSARNHWLTACLTHGEGYHSFHHAFPFSYRNGRHWYDYDLTKWVLLVLNRLGLAWGLRDVSENDILKIRAQTLHSKAQWPLQDAEERVWTASELANASDAGRLLMLVPPWKKNSPASSAAAAAASGALLVVDVTDFVGVHPGGPQLLWPFSSTSQQQQPGRRPLPPQRNLAHLMKSAGGHQHSQHAWNVLDSLVVGVFTEQ